MATTRYRINTKRYPLSLVSVPSLANYPHACIHTASLTDYALLVVSAVGEEFALCMSNRGKASLFESALLARGLGMEQLIVVLAKADAVVSELAPDWDTEAHEALIASREKQVVNLLLRMRFQRQNIHVVVTSAWEDKGFMSPFFAKGLSMADALENIRREELPLYKTRQQQKDQPAAPFRQALLRVKHRPGCCPAPYGRVLSGHFRPRQDLAYYPRTQESRLGIWNGAAPVISTEGAESFNETLVSASAGSCLCVFATKTPATRLLHSGMVAMHAKEDAGTMLELTVTEFTVSVRAINPVSAKGRRVLMVGQDVAVHSHGARVGCKVMAILSVKRGQNVVRGSLCEVCAGEVAEVRLRPLAGFVVEPFDVCPHMGRVLIRDTVTLAFGKVVRVARRYKSTFLDLLHNLEALWAVVEKEPACLLGRDEHNNTLLHLLIGGRHEGAGMVVKQVEGRFGRVAAQKLMRVRNTRGETAIHLALGCGWFEVAALLLSLGAPLVPSKEEQARLSKLWKKPIPSPIDVLDRHFGSAHASRAVTQAKERQPQRTPRSPLNLALLCLIVLTRDRDDFTNLEDMLPTRAMQELFAIAFCSLSSRQ